MRRFDQSVAHRFGAGFAGIETFRIIALRRNMGVRGRQKRFAGAARHARLDTSHPAIARQRARRGNGFFQCGLRGLIVYDEILQTFFQSARTAAGAAFGSADPSAQLRHFETGDERGETGIRRIEEMMAFVEDIAHAPLGLCIGRLVHDPIPRRLRDDECVIGDDDLRMPRTPDGALDETLAIMRTRRVDAFAAPVGQFAEREREAARNDGKPAPDMSPSDVACTQRAISPSATRR